jgi:hypothetical protein
MEVLLEHGRVGALLFINASMHIFLKGTPIKKSLYKKLLRLASAMYSDGAFEHLSINMVVIRGTSVCVFHKGASKKKKNPQKLSVVRLRYKQLREEFFGEVP